MGKCDMYNKCLHTHKWPYHIHTSISVGFRFLLTCVMVNTWHMGCLCNLNKAKDSTFKMFTKQFAEEIVTEVRSW